jgi:hypothetical protein
MRSRPTSSNGPLHGAPSSRLDRIEAAREDGSMNDKVLYHVGVTVGFKTKPVFGRLRLEGGRLLIQGEPAVSIDVKSLRSVELVRPHGAGRMLKISHGEGTLFVSVIRFNLFGIFTVVNFFATGRLKQELEAAMLGGGNLAAL